MKGFTLIELLVVISIIGVLATIGLNTFPGAIAKARDAQRVDDARKIVAAVQQYYTEKGIYPTTSGGWCRISTSTSCLNVLIPNYLPDVPVDPINTWTGVSGDKELVYSYRSDSSDYCMQVTQERDSSSSRNYEGSWNQVWFLRFGPYGPNGGLCN